MSTRITLLSPSIASWRPEWPFRGRAAILAFGFLCAFCSSFGQTFFVSIFGGALRQEFALTHGGFGTLYAAATLMSALAIVKLGALIDRVPLRRYALGVIAGLGVAACAMALSVHWLMLLGALFLLRLFGQGLMTHVALTTMAREFEANRGKAISIASMGYPAGEALFPAVMLVVLAAMGWRGAWGAVAAACFLLVLPIAMLLLRSGASGPAGAARRFGALRFLSGRPMLLALPAFMASGFIGTAIIFHQGLILAAKGWPASLFATGLTLYAAVSVGSMLAAGWIVDRFGPRRPALGFLLPLAAGCLLLAFSEGPWGFLSFMAGAGLSSGAYAAVTTSLLAAAYGVDQLGSIRAAAASVSVMSTSLSPMLFGVLADLGVDPDAIVFAFGLMTLLAAWLLSRSALTARPGAPARPRTA